MPHTPTLALAAVVLLLSPAAAIAASANDAAKPGASSGSPDIAQGFGLGDPNAPEGLWGGGPDFKVHFRPHGFDFHPALGSEAPHTPTWSYEVESVERGETALWARPNATSPGVRSTTGRVRSLELAPGLSERVEVLARGIELSYVLWERPVGQGDLAVRGRIASDLPLAAADSGGLSFAWPGLGGVEVGGVVGVDARGERARGAIELDGEQLVLSLPAAFVDAATYPLILDPLISTSTVASGVADHFDDLAYDFSSSSYLAVFTRVFSANDLDVRGQLLTGDGALIGFPLFLESSVATQARDATVAGANAANRFLVAWLEGGTVLGSPADDARMRAVGAPTGALSAIVPLDTSSGTEADLQASTQADGTQFNVLVAGVHAGATYGVRQVKVLASGDPTIGISLEVFTSAGTKDVAASGSGGAFGRHLFACIDGAGDLRLALVDGSNLLLGSLAIPTPAGHAYGDPAVDGDGTTFFVAWEDRLVDPPATGDVRCARIAWDGAALTLELDTPLLDDPATTEELGGLAFLGQEFLVSWSEDNAGGDADLLIAAFQSDCAGCEPIYMVTGEAAIDELAGASAAERSGGLESGDRALFGWSVDPLAAGVPKIVVGLFEELLGVQSDLGGGCGEGGLCSAPCARVGNPDFVHHLTGAAPGALALLDLGIAPIELPVGGGTLKTLPFLLLVAGFTDGAGSVALPMAVPNDPALVGGTIYDQWVVLDSTPCTDLGVDLSNGLQIQFQ